jgi:uncharacterized protein
MKLFVLGLTGRVGSKLVQYALEEQMNIKALIRKPEKVTPDVMDKISIKVGNVLDVEDLSEGMKGCDAIVSALSTDGGSVLSECTPLLIEAMKKNGISRIITIGTAGILQSRAEPYLLRYQSSESKRKLTRAAEEHHKAYIALEESSLDWTIVCPAYLPDGDATGSYRVEKDYLPLDGKMINTGDTAHFAFSLIKDTAFVRSRVGIAY